MLLVELDLAGADWVVTAYVAQEPRMIAVCQGKESPHTITAELITGASREKIKSEDKILGHSTDASEIADLRRQWIPEIIDEATIFLPRAMSCRQAAKKANHGLNYGMGPDKFSLINMVPVNEARLLHKLYHHTAYPGLSEWHGRIKHIMAKGNRTLENCFGRKVQFLGSVGPELFNQAFSWIPQSTVADITIEGLKKLHADERDWMRAAEALCQVHDSILFQYPLYRGFQDLAACIAEVAYGEEFLSPWCEYHGTRFKIGVECKVGFAWDDQRMQPVELSEDLDVLAGRLEETINGAHALRAA